MAQAKQRSRRSRSRRSLGLLLFFLVPMAVIWAYSFGENTGPITIDLTGTFANYMRALEPLYLGIFWQEPDRRRRHHAAVPAGRVSGGAGHRLRQPAHEGVAAAADHAAVLDQSADPHLRADRGAAREGLCQFRARMVLEQRQRADDHGWPAAAWRIRAADIALQQFRRGLSGWSTCTCRSWCCRSIPRSTAWTVR